VLISRRRATIRAGSRPACPARSEGKACQRRRRLHTPARAPCPDPRARGAARCPCQSEAVHFRSHRGVASQHKNRSWDGERGLEAFRRERRRLARVARELCAGLRVRRRQLPGDVSSVGICAFLRCLGEGVTITSRRRRRTGQPARRSPHTAHASAREAAAQDNNLLLHLAIARYEYEVLRRD